MERWSWTRPPKARRMCSSTIPWTPCPPVGATCAATWGCSLRGYSINAQSRREATCSCTRQVLWSRTRRLPDRSRSRSTPRAPPWTPTLRPSWSTFVLTGTPRTSATESSARDTGRRVSLPASSNRATCTSFAIDLGPTSNVFKKGHSIRVEISSSNFPRFDRNLNTGEPIGTTGESVPALQTIHPQSTAPVAHHAAGRSQGVIWGARPSGAFCRPLRYPGAISSLVRK